MTSCARIYKSGTYHGQVFFFFNLDFYIMIENKGTLSKSTPVWGNIICNAKQNTNGQGIMLLFLLFPRLTCAGLLMDVSKRHIHSGVIEKTG